MRAVVFAYHNLGCVCLQELLAQGHKIAAVVTHEDDPREDVWFQSVAQLARGHRLPVFTPDNPNAPGFVDQIRSLAPDVIFSFYYRHMLECSLLVIPPLGALNLHGSYLPKYRGRCSVNWVLVNGETETGVTLHYMIEEPDAGDVVAQRAVPISVEDTALTLHEKMTRTAQALFAETLPLLAKGTALRLRQDDSQATYYSGRCPEDGRFDWADSAGNIYNLVRAVTHPYPGAFTAFGQDKLFVWWCTPQHKLSGVGLHPPGTVVEAGPTGPSIATGDGTLLLLSVQVGDGPTIGGGDFAKAYSLSGGESLLVR